MEKRVVEWKGKRINLSSLSDEQLKKVDGNLLNDDDLLVLHQEIKSREKKYKNILEQYRAKYPFLRKIKID